MNVAQLLDEVAVCFAEAELSYGHGTDNPWDEAVYLVLSCCQVDDDEASLELPVTDATTDTVRQLAQRRVTERLPMAYLLGRCAFMGLDFYVQPGVIIPRSPIGYLLGPGLTSWLPDPPKRVLDLCTGSGCLGILAALHYVEAEVTVIELDAAAVRVAKQNIALHDLAHRVELVQGDATKILPTLTPGWDLIIE